MRPGSLTHTRPGSVRAPFHGCSSTQDVGRPSVRDVETLSEHLAEFMKLYLKAVGWSSQEKQLSAFVAGLLGGTERKSVSPSPWHRGPTAGSFWNHQPLLGQLQTEVSDVADAECGRSALFRDRLANSGERYMLEVPTNILVRKVAGKAGRRTERRRDDLDRFLLPVPPP